MTERNMQQAILQKNLCNKRITEILISMERGTDIGRLERGRNKLCNGRLEKRMRKCRNGQGTAML